MYCSGTQRSASSKARTLNPLSRVKHAITEPQCVLITALFQNQLFFKKTSEIPTKPNSLDQDSAGHITRSNLCLNCLQRLYADAKSLQKQAKS